MSETQGSAYIGRWFRYRDAEERERVVDEAGLIALPGSKVVLGEPGMGKSAFLREAARYLGVVPITASRFRSHPNPALLVKGKGPVLIDALDEVLTQQEGGAIDQLINQLHVVGAPEFTLCCRSREWQAHNPTLFRSVYEDGPLELTLEPFKEAGSRSFLAAAYPTVNAQAVLDHLDRENLSELAGNPLTLSLIGRIADSNESLPASRGALFEQVCRLTWSEHDEARRRSPLVQMGEDEALSAAGAMMAALLLAGAEAVSEALPGQVDPGDLRLAEVGGLPNADTCAIVLHSKLFVSDGDGRTRPVHRVIAEFLGARWLAKQAKSPRVRRRILRQLNGHGGVAASLRGLHAWLAWHSQEMAPDVIRADPFGVLRYGDTAKLSPSQGAMLFQALEELAHRDPHFRAQDWDSHTAAGLMIPSLRNQIQSCIASTASNEHLRSLVIEALKGTRLALGLAETLESVLFSPDRFYRERHAAAEALLPLRSRDWVRDVIDCLLDQATEDSPRLARNLIEDIGCDVDDDVLVRTILAEAGLLYRTLPRRRWSHVIHSYDGVLSPIDLTRAKSVLDTLEGYFKLIDRGSYEGRHDIDRFVGQLLGKILDHGAIDPPDAGRLWRWLKPAELARGTRREVWGRIASHLEENHALRHAIQDHVLDEVRRAEDRLWATNILELNERMVGLRTGAGDVIRRLGRLNPGDRGAPTLRADWCDLMQIGRTPGGIDPDIKAAGIEFARGDRELEDFLEGLENPATPEWEIEHQRLIAERQAERQAAFDAARQHYSSHRVAMRAGECSQIVRPAKAYLGRYGFLDEKKSPPERIAEWLGDDLMADALIGFEATLFRSDLPSPQQFARGIAENRTWNHTYAVVAGLIERSRTGQGIQAVPREACRLALLMLRSGFFIRESDDTKRLVTLLDQILTSTDEDREAFLRLWAEPSLDAGVEHIGCIHLMTTEQAWQAAGRVVAVDWLRRYRTLPLSVELELVDCLVRTGATDALVAIAAERASGIYADLERMLSWLAVDLIVRFEAVREDAQAIGVDCPDFLWRLRDRLQFEGRGVNAPISSSQARWMVSQFRTAWPYAVMQGSSSGSHNPHDASEFIRGLVHSIASDPSDAGVEAMRSLIEAPPDSYTAFIQHVAAQQQQRRVETMVTPLSVHQLADLLMDDAPANIDDLKTLVLEALDQAQRELLGDEYDAVRDFWDRGERPFNENRCRDVLARLLRPSLDPYSVRRMSERDMPESRRADLAFESGATMQLPMEVKGQWHHDVWSAATEQLDARYLIDWRSEGRGIYCVLWFGDVPSATGRRLRPPPDGTEPPATSEAMRQMLVERIPAARRSMIDIVVLDLSRGRGLA